MNQFKPIFLGTVDPNTELGKMKAAVNSQKCIRAGGKHNDLDDVGKDGTHHTFFEMLGNWSFGSYFKKEAIYWSFELLTKVYKLEKDRIYASYFGGDEKLKLEPDLEAKAIWEELLDKEKVLPFGSKENFWEMGDTGPCGPCSEIHYDFVGNRNAAYLVNKDDPTVIEIWNNVFIQFNREKDGSLSVLPDKHVDTGMGFERITSIIQGKTSNYDTDIFTPIFEEIQKVTGFSKPYSSKMKQDDVDGYDTAYRVIADHIRCITIAISDGGVPSNEGRGYVLRRIIRRAVTFGHKFLKAKEGFFHKLVPVVAKTLGDHFPEILKEVENVQTIIKEEEKSFGKTLIRGIKEFDKVAEQSKESKVISGKDAFTLYDTFGFPIEDTKLMAEEKGLKVDLDGYKKEKEIAIEKSKKNVAKEVLMSVDLGPDDIKQLSKIVETKKYLKNTEFTYEWKDQKTKVVALFRDKQFLDEVSDEKPVGLVLEKTSFYAESGGQIFDLGIIKGEGESEFIVHNVQSYAGFYVHTGIVKGKFVVDQEVETNVDFKRRKLVAANHTTTHMLNYALSNNLKDKVNQRGSLVTPDRLRFDFSYGKGLTPEEIVKVQNTVKEIIKSDKEVFTDLLDLEEAYKVPGVCALFGEQYPSPVRVVSIGFEPKKLDGSQKNSVEFCGGTHMKRTSEAKDFVILSESSISKGTRRIFALTGDAAKVCQANAAQFYKSIIGCKDLKGEEFNTSFKLLNDDLDKIELPLSSKMEFREEIEKLSKLQKEHQKQIEKELKTKLLKHCEDIAKNTKDNVIVENLKGFTSERKILGDGLEFFEKKYPNFIVMFVVVESGKVSVFTNVPKNLTNKVKSGEWCSESCKIVGGKGGGKDNQAQGTGTDVSKVDEMIKFALEYGKKKLE